MFEQCVLLTWLQFTSATFRNRAIQQAMGAVGEGEDAEAVSPFAVTWSNAGCQAGRSYGGVSCPHIEEWPYTVNDANLGRACQVGVNMFRHCG
jgi:hypothetical protein